MPDWSGQWEIVGVTPNASGGLQESFEQVLKEMQWSPPNKPEVQARLDQIAAAMMKSFEAQDQGAIPPANGPTCTWGFPAVMIDSPLMFEILPTREETVLIFSGREVRHVYTDGREHTPKDELWATPWGDSIGHWEGDTLVVDTIAVKSAARGAAPDLLPVIAFGGGGTAGYRMRIVANLSSQARFVERIRMADKGHLEDRITIIDPASLAGPWHLSRTYRRVANVHRMVYEDCEGEDRNPIVNGHYTIVPPPTHSFGSTPAPTNAPTGQATAPN
ncbi:MAG TPA: hypothetical protein VJO53_12160 [Candidatus Acidoferrales bacterium]|nr:hypothetical protein [Candidatus Acidoferrales bacterium]